MLTKEQIQQYAKNAANAWYFDSEPEAKENPFKVGSINWVIWQNAWDAEYEHCKES